MASDEAYFGSLSVPLFGVLTCAGIYFLRRYLKGAQFNEYVEARGKIALVTGASAGIGKQTARELNLRGATVYMLCRNHAKSQNARIELTKLGCDPTRLILKEVDLARFATIRKFSDEIKREVGKIDILVNNAGIMFYPKFELTEDGHEITWQTNYLGHFLLTELLLPLIMKSPNGRIINVSSSLHKTADSVDISIVNNKKYFSKSMPYGRSKLAQVMHARELTRRLRTKDPGTTVTINAVHPGVCFTELMRYTIFSRKYILKIISPILWFFMKTDKDGAQTTLYVALSKNVEGISGRYFGECKEHTSSSNSLDDAKCNILYNESLEAVKLSE
ncbi:oxidoreductase [Loa loa]|uniref:Oxidoreductase n=1 Tax=Loa loa TaxID=7209 RepID=A0A1I7W4J4_LOALO|nr:oxidoreductase [Loa loa]EFO17715.1 oxidoreductase [Loa loa]